MDSVILKALAAKRESRSIEFKSCFEPSSLRDLCEVIKDIVAIANSGGGGIVFGVDNAGRPVRGNLAPILSLDHAKLCDQIRKYTGVDFDGCAIHDAKKGRRRVAVMTIEDAQIPFVFTEPGMYPGANGPGRAFSKGEIVFRHGAKSEPGTTADIRGAFDRHFQKHRADANERRDKREAARYFRRLCEDARELMDGLHGRLDPKRNLPQRPGMYDDIAMKLRKVFGKFDDAYERLVVLQYDEFEKQLVKVFEMARRTGDRIEGASQMTSTGAMLTRDSAKAHVNNFGVMAAQLRTIEEALE